MKKNHSLIAMVIVTLALSLGVSNAYAQATQGLCISSFTYEIDPATPNSTYNWGIDDGTSGTDWTISSTTGTTTEVDWKVAGTYSLWSQETNEYGCVGPKGYVTVTVSDRPETPNLENNICSATQAGGTVDVVNLSLASGFSKYVFKGLVKGADITAAAGNAVLTAGDEVTDIDIIKNDAYTNAGTAVEDVVYTFAPYSATCGDVEGAEFTVTVHVYPEVKAPTIKF